MHCEDAPEHEAPTRPRGRPRRDAEMIPRILDAAERLLARRSVLSVSIRDIADEAGVPHSAIYRYFANKEDVLRQVLVRGRDRQRRRDAGGRAAGRPIAGAIEWIMNENRCYAMAIVRAAMEGETGSSLGLSPGDSAAMQSVRALADVAPHAGPRAGHDPRLVVAATMALSLGWAVAEEWIVDAAGLAERTRASVRAEVDEILAALVGLARDADQASPQG